VDAYVVSPGVDGASTGGSYVPLIKQHHIALMGWPADENDGEKKIGHRFAAMPEGSLVIVASGMNSSKSCVCAGFVGKSDPVLAKEIGIAQVRRLDSYVSLENVKLPFSVDSSKYYGQQGNRIPACYALDPIGYSADKAVIQKVIAIISKSQGAAMIDEKIKLLEKAKQIVLTGAPGTGKTYLARQIARSMVLSDEEKRFSESEIEKLVEARTKFVQFHPSYDYTDFVEGLRPIQGADGQVGFQRQDGTFKMLCKAAIAAGQSGGVDNFEEAWTKFIDDVKDRYSADKPLELTTPKSDCTFRVFANSRGNLSFITSGTDKVQGSLTKANVRQFYVDAPVADYWECYFKGVIAYLQDKKNGYGLKAYVAGKSVDPKDRQKFVIIIDEINRGDISKIFGELFYAIDEGYRGPKGRVETQYQNLVEESDVFSGGFYVPENVYIIGTMNDVDRNVESMDFAIRRRFTWEEIVPSKRFGVMMTGLKDSTGVEVSSEIVKQAEERMNRLNAAISDKKNGLGPAYQIGPSYFAKIKDYSGGADETFKALWDRHLRSLLYEYFRGMERVDETMAKLKDAYDLKNSQGANVASETDFPQQ